MVWDILIEKGIADVGLSIASVVENHPEELKQYLVRIWVVGVVVAIVVGRTRAGNVVLLWSSFVFLCLSQLWGYTGNSLVAILGWLQAVVVGVWTAIAARRLSKVEGIWREQASWAPGLLRAFSGSGEHVGREREGEKAPSGNCYVLILIALVLVLIAGSIRVWRLAEFPRHFYSEYARSGRVALEVLESGTPYLWKSFTSPMPWYLLFVEAIHYLLVDFWALLFLLFGVSITVMKILPTVLGIGAVVVLWWFGRRWMGKGVGESAAFLMAISPYMISWSRSLWAHVILAVLYVIVALHFLLLCLEKPTLLRMMIAGAVVSLSVYLYRATYVVIPTALFFIVWQLVADAGWRRKAWKPLLVSVVVCMIVTAPFIRYVFLKDYVSYVKRTAVTEDQQRGTVDLVKVNLKHMVQRLIYFRGDHLYPRIGESPGMTGHLHLPFTVGFFAFGVGAMLVSLRRRRVDQVLLLCGLLGVAPGLLSLMPPPRRFIVLETIFYLLAGRGAVGLVGWMFYGAGKKWRWGVVGVLAVVAMLLMSVSFGIYTRKVRGFSPNEAHQQAVHVASSIKERHVINVRTDFGLEDTVFLLSWPTMKMDEVKKRWAIITQAGQLLQYQLPADVRGEVEFIGGLPKSEGGDILGQLKARFTRYQRDFPEWEMGFHYDDQRPQELLFIWLRAPVEEYEAAREFALRGLLSWVPDASMKLKATGEAKEELRPGLLLREGELPLWKSSRVATHSSTATLYFEYSGENKPFESPRWFWWRGRLAIPRGGVYVIASNSDDGSDIWIDGIKILDNMGDHPPLLVKNAIQLEAGIHRFEVRYYDRIYGAVLQVMIQGPEETALHPVVQEWLYCDPEEAEARWEAR